MAKVYSMTMGIPGVEISLSYNINNLRITTVDWSLPQSGIVARVRIWDTGSLVYDKTVGGPETGSETIAGNYRVREVTEGNETFFDLPANITYSINVQTIG